MSNPDVLEKIIEEYQKDQDKREGKVQTSHYPSSWFKCQRALCYAFLGTPKSNPMTATNWLKLKFADACHDKLTLIIDAGENEKPQKDTWPGLERPFSMRMDNVTGGIPLEIKTTFGRGYTHKEEKLDEDYFAQCYPYNRALKTNTGKLVLTARDTGNILQVNYSWTDIKKGHVVCSQWNMYGSKIGSEIKYELDIPVAKYYTTCKAVEGAVKVETLLPGEFKVWIENGVIKDKQFQRDKKKLKSDWHCLYCDWRDLCKEPKKYQDLKEV
jgi:hypothetical protein